MEDMNEPPFEGVKAVLADSEGIKEWQRKIVEKNFGAKVFLSYGMVEKVLYGGACNDSNAIHLYPQYGVSETLSEKGGGAEIIGTGFINRAMPMIRYRTSDMGEIGGFCEECGRPYSLIREIEGRSGDYLVDRCGNIISTLMLGARSDCFNNVKVYQFYQEEKGKALLRIVKKKTYPDSDTIRLRHELNKELEITDNLDIEIVFVDDVARTVAGKTRLIVQKLDIKEVVKT